jgi:hypothetical protein
MNDFIEHEREPRRFPISSGYGVTAKRTFETLASSHVRFPSSVAAMRTGTLGGRTPPPKQSAMKPGLDRVGPELRDARAGRLASIPSRSRINPLCEAGTEPGWVPAQGAASSPDIGIGSRLLLSILKIQLAHRPSL